jgi:hypothetical protein
VTSAARHCALRCECNQQLSARLRNCTTYPQLSSLLQKNAGKLAPADVVLASVKLVQHVGRIGAAPARSEVTDLMDKVYSKAQSRASRFNTRCDHEPGHTVCDMLVTWLCMCVSIRGAL